MLRDIGSASHMSHSGPQLALPSLDFTSSCARRPPSAVRRASLASPRRRSGGLLRGYRRRELGSGLLGTRGWRGSRARSTWYRYVCHKDGDSRDVRRGRSLLVVDRKDGLAALIHYNPHPIPFLQKKKSETVTTMNSCMDDLSHSGCNGKQIITSKQRQPPCREFDNGNDSAPRTPSTLLCWTCSRGPSVSYCLQNGHCSAQIFSGSCLS